MLVWLEMHGELRVIKVRVTMRVFLQMCMDFLEMKFVLVIGVGLTD